jgi:hypothetical protein
MQLLTIHHHAHGNFKPRVVDFDYYSVIIKLGVPTKPEDGPPHTSNEPFSVNGTAPIVEDYNLAELT